MTRTIRLNETDIKTALKIMNAESGINSIAELAKKLDMNDTTLRSALNNGALRVVDFLKITELLGYTVDVVKKEV